MEESPMTLFSLDDEFLKTYRDAPCPLETNPLAKLVFLRTYSRGGKETWFDVIRRVVEGTFHALQRSCHRRCVSDWRRDAESMFDTFFHLRALPPGRGLWAMGTPITETKGLGAPLNNCAFISTAEIASNLPSSFSEPFAFLMDASMLGCGVGIDTAGATHRVPVRKPAAPLPRPFSVDDSREGWVDSVRALLESYVAPVAEANAPAIEFDYSAIRPKGAAIVTFGGITSGPDALRDLHVSLRKILDDAAYITSTVIADIANLIGVAVISGNVRRTAEIVFGDPDDAEFAALKDYRVNPHRAAFGWTSNNSLFARTGQAYDQYVGPIAANGEPGFVWLENARRHGRMGRVVVVGEDKESCRDDGKIAGTNPCGEIGLEPGEFCNLAEVFPCAAGEDYETFRESLRVAFLYAKAVTLFPVHWPRSAEVVDRNRRIGVGLSGIAQFLARRPLSGSGGPDVGAAAKSSRLDVLRDWCNRGYAFLDEYDTELSALLNIPTSIKRTTIKPSGTVSLLASATPGLHYPVAPWYIRRVTLSGDSPYAAALARAGYTVEPSAYDADSVVVEFPCSGSGSGSGPIRAQSSVSMWEQLELAAFLQREWADNQVSATITFDPEREAADIPRALDYYQYRLKGISFLPSTSPSNGGEYWAKGVPPEAIGSDGSDENATVNLLNRALASVPVTVRVHRYTPLAPKRLVVSGHPSIFVEETIRRHFSVPDASLVPLAPYAQMPYEPISEEEYSARVRVLSPVTWANTGETEEDVAASSSPPPTPQAILFCDGDSCTVMGTAL